MNRNVTLITLAGLLGSLAAACGPTQEEIANGDDPIAAALVLGALSNSHRTPLAEGDFARLSPHAQAIVAEGARRARPEVRRDAPP